MVHFEIAVTISSVSSRQIFDSRGRPTVEAVVLLSDGSIGTASAPSGASVGKLEALELRDSDPAHYGGYGVTKAIENVKSLISPALAGMSPFNQDLIDRALIALDGTHDKSKLGANATTAVSIAVAKAAAISLGVPMYKYLGGTTARVLPIPLVNVINGGVHADNGLDFQEFMIVPIGARKFVDAMKMCSEVFLKLKGVLKSKGYSTNTGDEGGFAPDIHSNDEVFSLLLSAIEGANYTVGKDFALALDVASSTFYDCETSTYRFAGTSMSRSDMVAYYKELIEKYHIISIEDAMAEQDIAGWQMLTEALGKKVQLVGDDLFVTNPALIRKYIKLGLGNAVLIKPNQVGTLTETMDAIQAARISNYESIISHRSGETEDVYISHIAVAMNCTQIKSGSMSRSERLAKYNELLRIEEDLGEAAMLSNIA